MKRFRYALLILFCCVACLTCPKDNDTPAWENISQNSGNSVTTSVVVDDGNNVSAVWADSTPRNVDIFFTEKTSTGYWSEGINISNSPSLDAAPFVDIDSRGNVHVCWWQQDFALPAFRIMYRMRDAAGNWGASEILAESNSFDSAYTLPRIICDVNDNVFVDWEAFGTLSYMIKDPGGGWSDMMTVPNAHASNPAQLATDKAGNIYLVWDDGGNSVAYQMRTTDGTWQDYAVITEGSSQPLGPDITVDGSGIVYITWAAHEGNQLYYIYYAHNASGDWSEPTKLPKVSDDDTGMLNSVAASDDRTIHFIWSNLTKNAEGSYEASEIYYAYKLSNDTWSSIHNLSNTEGRSWCYLSSIALAYNDDVHIVWADEEPGNFDALYIMIPADSLD